MKHLTLLSLLAAAWIGASCSAPAPKSSSPNGTDGAKAGKLSVKGSDTMVQLAQAWAQEFMKAHPEIQVTVTGGGTNTGIAALLNGGTEIANASRAIKDEEREAARKNSIVPVEFEVAQDALSIIVHPSNPVQELTMAQLADIFLGKTTNWKDLGGPDRSIVANSRDSSSGTYVFFQEHVLGKQPFGAAVLHNPATTAIVENVSQDEGAIGYVGLGYVNDRVRAIPLRKDTGSRAVAATVENVLSGNYPLSRALFQYSAGEPEGAVKAWLDWVRGPEGQAIVEKLGFVPIQPKQ